MKACRQQERPGQEGTWILPKMERAYYELQKQGNAISLECYNQGLLVGGIYGVLMNHLFCGDVDFLASLGVTAFAG
jgi:leucyl/phenylalanyl-tRNA--protein transferase